VSDAARSRPPVWYFKPGTESAIEVVVYSSGDLRIFCPLCGEMLALNPRLHGASIADDGAVSTATAFGCPTCGKLRAELHGGVMTIWPLEARHNPER
jgi:ribosomal protein S27E